jgi:hypothetical protein
VGLVLDPRIPIAVACLGVVVAVESTVVYLPLGDATHVFRPRPEAMVTLALMVALLLGSHLRSRELTRL